MIGKVDLVMWAKNGAETLPFVLKRIGEVIPDEFVNNRIIVDDNSTDDTREITRTFGWKVALNEGTGISDGANTALKRVETEFFISFEQDLLLAKDWWNKVPPLLLEKENVAVASGIRIPDNPSVLRRLHEYITENYREESRRDPTHFYGKTLDNAIYKPLLRFITPRLRLIQ